MTKKGKNLLIWKSQVTKAKKDAFINNELQLQNCSSAFIQKKKKSFPAATSILIRSPLAYNATASLNKLTCSNYVDFDKCQDRFGYFSWSKSDSNYWYVKLNVSKKDDNKEFRLVQNFTMGEAVFEQLKRLRNELVIAAENVAREQNLFPVLIPKMSEEMDELLELAHKIVDVVDRANRKICVTLIRYNVNKTESSYAQVQLFASKNMAERFQQIVYVNYKLEKFIYLHDLKSCVYDKLITNQPVYKVV